MFFQLSKLLDLAAAPLSWALALLVVAVVLRRRPGISRLLAASSVLVLLVFSCQKVSGALLRAAERKAPSSLRPGVVYDVVVVLGGAIDPGASRRHGRLELNPAGDRLLHGWELVRGGEAREIAIAGGSVTGRAGDPTEAEVAAEALAAWGIPPERIVTETRSRNTRENAVEIARIARERGWRRILLVTSALHMERALGCFRAAGLSPDALPVDWHDLDPRDETWLPRAAALADSTDVLHELVGRVVYRIVGYAK